MKNLVVFTIDDNYVAPFCTAIASFIEHHNTARYLIGLIYADLSENNLEKIRIFFVKNNLELITKQIEDIFQNIYVGYHFNSVIFYRLLIPSIFKKYEKVLYIDSDVIFIDNIDKLFSIELNNFALAAIPKTFLGVPNHLQIKKYFASGLLLLNINVCNNNNLLKMILLFLKNNKYVMPDQDALNAVVKNWKEIDLRYGVETAFLDSKNQILQKALNNPAIIQFSGSSKPWQYMNDHPYKQLYWYYLKKTPYRNYRYEDYSLINVIKKHTPKTIKEFIKKAISIK